MEQLTSTIAKPIKYYKVGGCVRDELLGVAPKDIDYSVEAPSYEEMCADIVRRGGEVFDSGEKAQITSTAKAKVPGLGIADFVLCRIDGPYSDGRRPDWVKPAPLLADLQRRDFRMNAIAIGEDGVIHDPFNGREDIQFKVIQCVGVAKDRMTEDSLRLLRAIRFSITKEFIIAPEVEACLVDPEIINLLDKISIERIREELLKCFKYSTRKTLHMLTQVYPGLGTKIFDNPKLKLIPTIDYSS